LPGESFDVSNVTSQDRILEIIEIAMRSVYARTLESNAYSSYLSLLGSIRGIEFDNDEPNLIVSYALKSGVSKITEKQTFYNEAAKMIPYVNGELSENTEFEFKTLMEQDILLH
jgi:hypothetical protein